MKEEMKNEIEKYAEKLGVSVEQAQADYEDIVAKHDLNLEDENEFKIARSLFRSKFSQQMALKKKEAEGESTEYDGPTFTKTATGFFYAVEGARDWEENRRNNLLADYQRDATACLNSGSVAVAVSLEDGRYEVTMLSNGEMATKVMEKIPDSAMQVDDDKWIIPVDNRKAWASGQANPNYGKPLPAEAWSRRLFFVGKVDDGEYQEYQLRMSGEQCKDFAPKTFNWCSFTCVPNSNNASILSARKDGSTVSSLNYLESDENIIEVLQSVLGERIVELTGLESAHTDNSHKKSDERIIVTDGNVENMNLQQTANGNQTLYLSDLNADFNWDGEGYSSVTCWIPSYIEIDFGIGSNVIVCGRTSQGTDRETGELRNVSINVLGLYAIDRHGSAEVNTVVVEDNGEWF